MFKTKWPKFTSLVNGVAKILIHFTEIFHLVNDRQNSSFFIEKANMNAIWMNTEHANILVCYQLYSPELMYIQDRIERCKFDFF